ncbi:YdeI/OmpD-associated family protein [Candidatus Woesebacteria bacterium]|nr:YdeI/OmpD-associated family protein [Candidatus Woesebacteria bacterium]
MSKVDLPDGTIHSLPQDLARTIQNDKKMLAMWQEITPLARNEWICWVESAKKDETRKRRIEVGKSKMHAGERRPCCWAGCLHRTDKVLSPTQKWLKNRSAK